MKTTVCLQRSTSEQYCAALCYASSQKGSRKQLSLHLHSVAVCSSCFCSEKSPRQPDLPKCEIPGTSPNTHAAPIMNHSVCTSRVQFWVAGFQRPHSVIFFLIKQKDMHKKISGGISTPTNCIASLIHVRR